MEQNKPNWPVVYLCVIILMLVIMFCLGSYLYARLVCFEGCINSLEGVETVIIE